VAGAGQPRLHEGRGRVERLLGPGDRLAELPVAAVGDVARRLDAVAERRPTRRHVLEEPPRDHVVGVALGRARELRALAHGRQAAGRALRVDGAEQRGTAVRGRERGDEVTGMRAVRCGGGRGRDDEEEKSRRERPAESILATHVTRAAPSGNRQASHRRTVVTPVFRSFAGDRRIALGGR
jgi:hypothetical protein